MHTVTTQSKKRDTGDVPISKNRKCDGGCSWRWIMPLPKTAGVWPSQQRISSPCWYRPYTVLRLFLFSVQWHFPKYLVDMTWDLMLVFFFLYRFLWETLVYGPEESPLPMVRSISQTKLLLTLISAKLHQPSMWLKAALSDAPYTRRRGCFCCVHKRYWLTSGLIPAASLSSGAKREVGDAEWLKGGGHSHIHPHGTVMCDSMRREWAETLKGLSGQRIKRDAGSIQFSWWQFNILL